MQHDNADGDIVEADGDIDSDRWRRTNNVSISVF